MKRIKSALFILVVCAGGRGYAYAASSATVNLTATVVATFDVGVSTEDLDLSNLVTGDSSRSDKVTITVKSNAPAGKLEISGCDAGTGEMIKLKKGNAELPFSLVHTNDEPVTFTGGRWSHSVNFTDGSATLPIWLKYKGKGMPPAPGTYTCALTIEAKAQ